MSAQQELEGYLRRFRSRITALVLARAGATVAVTVLVITLVGVYLAMRRAFDPAVIGTARLIIVVVVGGGVAVLLAGPLRRFRRSRGIGDIEQRVPAFDGRLEAYDALAHAESGQHAGFLGLLADDALSLARRIPVTARIPAWRIAVPTGVAVLSLAIVVGMSVMGPGLWRYGVRDLWAGWFMDQTPPPQSIQVQPGDQTVRRGADLIITAQAEGFVPSSMQVFARFGAQGEWQNADMKRDGGHYTFTFYAVRAPLQYYVDTHAVRSSQYTVEVVDVPAVEQIKLTYRYPSWSHLHPRVEEPGGDIRAVAGTRVEVQVETGRPLDEADLVVNGKRLPMHTEGKFSTAIIPVARDGQYHVSTRIGGDPVSLTDHYFISVLQDQKPTIQISRPGRDAMATRIEEVPVTVKASDDFGLDGVSLHYSVNGGMWKEASLGGDHETNLKASKTLFLETMTKPEPTPMPATFRAGVDTTRLIPRELIRRQLPSASGSDQPSSEAAEPDKPKREALEPGDLITYYAQASDRGQTVRSDLYFVQVEPFEMSYSQSSRSGRGAGGGAGMQQNEISSRQKEILVATWNLIRQGRDQASGFLNTQQIDDNAKLLAQVQSTLEEQAKSLARRTRARQQVGGDPRIDQFVRSLEQAAKAMEPAAQHLTAGRLSQAVAPEQKALQYLVRAESLFTNIQVSFQRNGQQGSAGLAGRDLRQLFSLEMDTEKNQYETEAPVSFQQQHAQALDETIRKLQALARRQQSLARRTNGPDEAQPLTPAERWQQKSLRRDAEQLQQRLKRLQRRVAANRSAQNQPGQQDQQAQSPRESQPPRAGQPASSGSTGRSRGQAGTAASAGDSGVQQAVRSLDKALQAMNRAAGSGENSNPAKTRHAVEQARRALQRALEQMTAQRQANAQAAFSALANRSQQLYAEQRRSAAALHAALQQGAKLDRDQLFLGAITAQQTRDISRRKAQLGYAVDALKHDIEQVARQFRVKTPGATERLDKTLTQLQKSQASSRLKLAANGIRRGYAVQVAATDAVTTSALHKLMQGTGAALKLAHNEAVAGGQSTLDPGQQLLAQLRGIRHELDALRPDSEERRAGHSQAQGKRPSHANTRQNDGRRSDGAGEQTGGTPTGGGYYDPQRSDVWDAGSSRFNWSAQQLARARQSMQASGKGLVELARKLDQQGLGEDQLNAARSLGQRLQSALDGVGTGNAALIGRKFQNLTVLINQLELRLAGTSQQDSANLPVRTDRPIKVERQYKEAVAEYYRRLSQPLPAQ